MTRRPESSAPGTSDRRLKILFMIGTLDVGGTEVQLVKLASGLDRERFDPVVCCLSVPGPLSEELTANGIRVESFDFRSLRGDGSFVASIPRVLLSLFRVVCWLRAEAPDVVHCMLFHAYVIGTVAARAARVPVVVTSRRSLSNFKAGKPHYWLAERMINPLADLVIANSQAVRRDALRREGLPAEKVIVIHNGLELERYAHVAGSTRREDTRRKLGIDVSAPVVAVVANFIHYKGHEHFLEAWSEILRRRPESVALLVGDGLLRPRMEAEATARGVAGSLRFLGTRHDVPDLLEAADLLAHPSLEEGFANAILEAMAAGRPIVATRVGGNPEAVEDGVTGLLVAPRDGAALAAAILWLLERPEVRERFGDEARRRAERLFSVGRLIERHQQVYEDLVAAKGRRAPPVVPAGSAQ